MANKKKVGVWTGLGREIVLGSEGVGLCKGYDL